ncbi:MAG: helix-turn-helix domain-containing protein [Actinomycetota bacterium]
MDRTAALTDRLTEAGWTVDAQVLDELEGRVELDDPGAVKALVNPLRLKLVGSLARSPASAKELAVRFDVPATRLYHHLDLLEQIGAIRVVASRRSGARTERCYGGVRGGVGLDGGLFEGDVDEIADAVAGLASLGGEAAAASIRTGRMDLNDEHPEGFLSLALGRLTREQRDQVSADLEALLRRVGEWSTANDEAGTGDAESTMLMLIATPDVTFDAPE